MKKFLRILVLLAAWAAVTWAFREKLLPVPKPATGPAPHFRETEPPPVAAPAPATPAPAIDIPTSVTAVDDLKVVKGIGPVFQKRLAQIGITSFAQLAAADASAVATSIDVAESRVENWIGQADELAG